MSWLANLVATYDQCFDNPAYTDEKIPLLPTDHVSPQAHIEVTLDGDGCFRRALLVDKEATLIPATEASAGRSSGLAPHGLSDTIQYLAEDYKACGGSKASGFALYSEQLTRWKESSFSHPKARAIRNYLLKGTLIQDLVSSQLFELNSEGYFKVNYLEGEKVPELLKKLGKEKGQYKDPGSALVRWRVEIKGEHATVSANCWEDTSLQKAWCDYLASLSDEQSLCYITGQLMAAGANHPKFIRRPGDSAKLVSVPSGAEKAGTLKGFYAFKGRFITPEQACTLGWLASQKAHNALRWLIARQGYKNGEQVVVSWEQMGIELPELFSNTADTFDDDDDDDLNFADFDETMPESDVGQQFSRLLNKKIAGYRTQLGDAANIITLGMEAATPGRLSVTFYRELAGSDFLNRIEKWHSQFSWRLRMTRKDPDNPKKTVTHWLYSAPAPREIAEAAYGSRLDDNLKKATIARLLPCILDEAQIPGDLVNQAVRRAANPMAFKKDEKWQWEKTLGIACALVKGQCWRSTDSREYTTMLDLENKNRDYLHGCLLAIAENIEAFALRQSDEERPTNAERSMQRFYQRPYDTWPIIELAIQPYCQRLKGSSRSRGFIVDRHKQLDDVLQQIEQTGGFIKGRSLEGDFLLGYHCMRRSLKSGKKNTDNARVN